MHVAWKESCAQGSLAVPFQHYHGAILCKGLDLRTGGAKLHGTINEKQAKRFPNVVNTLPPKGRTGWCDSMKTQNSAVEKLIVALDDFTHLRIQTVSATCEQQSPPTCYLRGCLTLWMGSSQVVWTKRSLQNPD